MIKAIYAEDRAEAAELLEEYCNQWYFADLRFTQAPWFDSHQRVDDSELSVTGPSRRPPSPTSMTWTTAGSST